MKKRDLKPVLAERFREIGVPDEALEKWDGDLLSLYRDSMASGADDREVMRQLAEKQRQQNWALDLGHFAMLLSRDVGASLERFLTENGIAFEQRSLRADYVYRKARLGRNAGDEGDGDDGVGP
jgi:hypothetical protein